MPSVSKSQARLMAAAAHTPGGYDGVPQSVGAEFNEADTGKKVVLKKNKKLKARGFRGKKSRTYTGA